MEKLCCPDHACKEPVDIYPRDKRLVVMRPTDGTYTKWTSVSYGRDNNVAFHSLPCGRNSYLKIYFTRTYSSGAWFRSKGMFSLLGHCMFSVLGQLLSEKIDKASVQRRAIGKCDSIFNNFAFILSFYSHVFFSILLLMIPFSLFFKVLNILRKHIV